MLITDNHTGNDADETVAGVEYESTPGDWWHRLGSNQWPSAYEAPALPLSYGATLEPAGQTPAVLHVINGNWPPVSVSIDHQPASEGFLDRHPGCGILYAEQVAPIDPASASAINGYICGVDPP